MKKLMPVIVTIVTIIFLSGSCYYDNEESLYPLLDTSCDTVNVTFSGSIKPMLSNYCLSCHSNTSASFAGNNIKLEDYSDVLARTNAVAGSINHTGSYSPMPKNGGKLNDCLLTKFDIWVKNGSQNN